MQVGGTAWQWAVLCTIGGREHVVFKQNLKEASEAADWRSGSRQFHTEGTVVEKVCGWPFSQLFDCEKWIRGHLILSSFTSCLITEWTSCLTSHRVYSLQTKRPNQTWVSQSAARHAIRQVLHNPDYNPSSSNSSPVTSTCYAQPVYHIRASNNVSYMYQTIYHWKQCLVLETRSFKPRSFEL